MTKSEFLKNLLIKPKSLELTGGDYKHDPNAEIYTNADTDISYLLELANFSKKPQVIELETEYSVLMIGKKTETIENYDFYDDEEYNLQIGEESILIVGATVCAMLLGLKAFIRMQSEVSPLPQMQIRDYPDIPFRSVHTCIFRPDDGSNKEETHPEYIKKMIKTAALAGYNHIIIEFWGMFPYSMPYAHWPNAYTREEIADLVSFAIDKMHITPIPAQNLTTHAGWSRIVTRQHTVLDQRPDLAEMYIPGGWCFATENPKTKQFLMQVMDELIEVFRNPPYLHCCCDKAFGFGSTEEDRRTSADILYAKHISFLNAYLTQKNVRMVMWADMLYCSVDALYWKCRESTVDLLPKNILMNIWTHDNPGKRWLDAEFFEERGFETVYSPFLNEVGTENMIAICKDRGSRGIVQTTWYCPQTALPCVVLSGALQWCGKKPQDNVRKAFMEKWYQ